MEASTTTISLVPPEKLDAATVIVAGSVVKSEDDAVTAVRPRTPPPTMWP
ncbi:MAG: hypothetical protein GTO22_03825, partial [Gemmatimonadales bacterium]|nr:hypothetical protein [Gemmatimonadales bacterium]